MNFVYTFVAGAVIGGALAFAFYAAEIRIGKAIITYSQTLVGAAHEKESAVTSFIVTKAHEAVAKL